MTRRFLARLGRIAIALAAFAILTAARADEPSAESAATRFVALSVYPSVVSLNHADDYQKLIAVAQRADGVTLDVTALASWRTAVEHGGEDAVRFEEGRVTASSDGLARVAAEFAGLRATTDVHSSASQPAPGVSFRHDVMPVFMRAGCNAGGCHGASRGKDGFRLSLFGFDPAGDHFRLTRERPGRRVNLALPEESLLLQKAIAAAPHTGGKRFDKDSVYYEKLREWVEAGAPNDVEDAPEVTALRIYPPRAAVGAGGRSQRFIAVAEYSDGATRDVTHLAVFQSNNTTSAAVDEDGLVTTGARGEAFVMARFDTHTVGSQVLVLPTDEPFTPADETPANYIDELVTQKLSTLRVRPSGLAGDAEFLRRVTIDISGRLPTVEEYEAFMADSDPDKRAAKVDELLAEPEFAQVWGQKWSDLLLVRTEPNRVEYKPMFLYSEWVTDQIEADRPLDDIFRDLLGASGSTFESPEANFYQVENDQKKIAENVAQVFLGIRMQCAQCHNHPFDRWTMDDYYAFTAFFSQIARKRGEDYREMYVFNRGRGEARHPVGNRVMAPKFLGGKAPDVEGKDRRQVVAEWVTSPENPYFAKSVANRVWAHFFGAGIVEPVDDVRVSNPPSNPELFETLGEKLVEYDFSLRMLVRDICNSHAYQRTCEPTASNEGDTRNFARAQARRIPAETLLDCLSQATAAPEKLPGLPLGSRAVQIADGRAGNYFLTTFGRSRRETVCACEAKSEPTLSQALHLLNGSSTQGKIRRGKLVKKWLEDGKTPEEVIEQVFLRCLTRPPSAKEREELLAMIPDDGDPTGALEDVFWAVLNSREFLFNH